MALLITKSHKNKNARKREKKERKKLQFSDYKMAIAPNNHFFFKSTSLSPLRITTHHCNLNNYKRAEKNLIIFITVLPKKSLTNGYFY